MPSDINNPVDRAAEPHFGTLPKALTKKVGDISGELSPGLRSVTHAQGGGPVGKCDAATGLHGQRVACGDLMFSECVGFTFVCKSLLCDNPPRHPPPFFN